MRRRHVREAWLLLTPALIGVAVFFAAPFVVTVLYSFTFGVGGVRFIFLDNYIRVMANDSFQLAASNTGRFIATATPAIMLISFSLALLLMRKLPGSRPLRAVLLLPMVVPVASTVMVVRLFFAENGVFNGFLLSLGLPVEKWLDSPAAFGVLTGLYLWKNTGYCVILMLAGLNMIPQELYHAAEVEGAGEWRKLRHITLPLMVPTLFFVFVMAIIQCFGVFREAYILGGRYPHDSIFMLQHFMNINFENMNYPRLSVSTVLVFVIIFAATYLFFRLQSRYGQDKP